MALFPDFLCGFQQGLFFLITFPEKSSWGMKVKNVSEVCFGAILGGRMVCLPT